VETLEDFGCAFTEALGEGRPSIVEVRTRREETHARRREVVEVVVRAMKELFGPPGTPAASTRYQEDEQG
jgi:hypothetical protein